VSMGNVEDSMIEGPDEASALDDSEASSSVSCPSSDFSKEGATSLLYLTSLLLSLQPLHPPRRFLSRSLRLPLPLHFLPLLAFSGFEDSSSSPKLHVRCALFRRSVASLLRFDARERGGRGSAGR
jgi:hypothetical protein